MKKLDFFKFTDKEHHPLEIMAAILGFIAMVSITVAAVIPYFVHAQSMARYGMVCVMAVMFALISIGLAIAGKMQIKSYGMFSRIAAIEDAVVVIIGTAIIIIGR